MKNFHLDLVRVTEAGAISAAEWVGRGNKEAADKAATEAMRDRLNRINFLAEIAIGEGKKDNSFGLYEGEILGYGQNERLLTTYHPKREGDPSKRDFERQFPEYSIAVDPIEGTTPTAKGGYEAMSVIALGDKDAFFKTDAFYMHKLAVGPEARNAVDITVPLHTNVVSLADALRKPLNRVTVCMLDRPRHAHMIQQLRDLGCRIKLIQDCDVTACIATCVPDGGIDMYVGAGGSPEAVIAAAAMKCLGGKFQAVVSNDDFTELTGPVLGIEDLAKGPVMFCATGITDGKLLKGVQFNSRGVTTHSIAMRSESGTVRRITTDHGN